MNLSIIIPTSGSPRIKYLLESLVIQNDIQNCEIILVTNNFKAVRNLIQPYQQFLSVVPCDIEIQGHPASILRNFGAKVARNQRLLFLDNDVIIAPGTIEKHAAGEGHVICGVIRELPADSQVLLKTFHDREFEILWRASLTDYRESLITDSTQLLNVSWKNLYSGNFSVDKDDFLRVNGFDETGHRCHDLELGLRLEKNKLQIELDSTCKSIHIEHPRSLLTRIEQLNGWHLMAERHPEVSDEIMRNAAASRQRIKEKLVKCSSLFSQLTTHYSGLRCGAAFVLKPGTDSSPVKASLTIPYEYKVKNDCETFKLRLARDCWDFSIIIPSPGILTMPYFSVIIPMFNSGRLIQRAIDSVFSQSFQSFEIIIVDDGSSQEYSGFISRYSQDGRMRILYHRENLGLSAALNTGLEAARGRYIIHLDSDDWLGSECLEALQYELSVKPEIGALYGSPYVHEGDDTWREMGWQVESPAGHFSYPLIQAPRVYKKQLLLDLGGWSVNDPYDGRFYEDRLMLARINDISQVKYCDSAIYNVNVREHSLGRGDKKNLAASKYIITTGQAAIRSLICKAKYEGNFLATCFENIPDEINLPKISVVIPHRERWEYLEYTIQSWIQSDLPKDSEIIVVNDGPDPGKDLFNYTEKRVKLVSLGEKRGAAAARNKGAKLSKGDMIIFCDCDHIVPEDICTKLFLSHKNGADIVVADVFGRRTFTVVSHDIPGRCKKKLLEINAGSKKFSLIAGDLLSNKKFKLLESNSENIYRNASKNSFVEKWTKEWAELILLHGINLQSYPHRWLRANTGLLSVSHQFFNSIGGFDENFNLSMEDWEFGIRAIKAGGKIELRPDAEPLHQVHPLDERRLWADTTAANMLIKLHPETIDSLKNCPKHSSPPGAQIILGSLGQSTSPAFVDQVSNIDHEVLNTPEILFALTFDDGPHLTGTPVILNALEKLGIRATFFFLASQIPSNIGVCKSILMAGHEIGLHGWDHTPLVNFEPHELRNSFVKCLNVFTQFLGYQPKFYRPPYGRMTLEANSICESLNLTVVGWDVAVDDWSGLSSKQLIKQFANQIPGKMNNSVILLHDGTGDPLNTSEFIVWMADNFGSRIKFLPLSDYLDTHGELPQIEPFEQRLAFENLHLKNMSLSDVILRNSII